MENNNTKEFKLKGYVHLRNYFSETCLKAIIEDSNKILTKAKKGKWEHIRVYRNFFSFHGLNIFGIDFPFNNKISNTLYKNFNNLNYKEDLLKILDWKDFRTTTLRLHSNSSFYNYQGAWHRDDKNYPSPNSIQAILYLKDEGGFRIVPKQMNHRLKKYNIDCYKSMSDNKYELACLEKGTYDTINAKRGDLFIFESGLLHQGFCKTSRLHFHLRHEKLDKVVKKINAENKYNFQENLLPDFDICKIDINHNYLDKRFLSNLSRIKNSIIYFFPRIRIMIKNLHSPIKQDIKASSFWQ